MVSAEGLRGSFPHLQSTTALPGLWRKGTSLSYSLAVALLFGKPETAEMESAVPLRKPGPGRSLADCKRSV